MIETTRPELEAYQEERLAKFVGENEKLNKGQIVFAGDSITEFFALKKYLGRDFPLVNRGIAGTDSVWLLEHLKEQVLDLEPSKLAIMIGINDIGRAYPIQDIVNRISDIVMAVRQESLFTEIYLLSVLPVSERPEHSSKVKIRNNATVRELNQQLAVLPGVTYVDLYDYLTDAQGQLNDTYTTDGLHLSPQGYQVLAEPIKKEILE
ncbi:SGNH/GDSL hydrolase family protein [uncultured Streptococcus sp.]|uniref:SGNH/GDSL hydrolase family protein n=1 Tax=uncultured Streptococcus sp. TaxID=83427 RepID=UPI0025830259|nr:SGNH/GDSL hydrolase family protein [uncultured Streptococcus sp.]